MKGDKRKERLLEEQRKKHQEEQANLPSNKFLNSDFSIAKKMRAHIIANVSPVEDDMRKIQAYISEIRNRKLKVINLSEQIKSNSITERDPKGNIISKDEAHSLMLFYKLSTYGLLDDIRKALMNHLLAKVDDKFTGEMFNEYAEKVDAKVFELGYELFPTELKAMNPE